MKTADLRAPSPEWGRPAAVALAWTCLLAACVCVVGLFVEPHRTWAAYLVGFHLLVGLALAGPVGLAFLHLSGARWARSIESVPRAMTAALPAAAALGLVLIAGVHSLFEWSHASAVAGDPILEEKAPYLNLPFFAIRLVLFFALWIWASRAVVRASERAAQDEQGTRRGRLRAAAVFLFVLAPTWSLASVDWLQSLDPHWFSTIYALVTLSGMALAGLAACIVLVAALDTHGQVTEDQYGGLGALLLSLALFWGYIWYCQYMLIWYTNLPEETFWYVARLGGAWGVLTKVSCVLSSALPFVLLLIRKLRRNRRALVRIAALVLAGRVVDLLVLSGPPLMGATPVIGIWELAGVVGPVALFFLLVIRRLQRGTAAAPATDSAGGVQPLPAVGPEAARSWREHRSASG